MTDWWVGVPRVDVPEYLLDSKRHRALIDAIIAHPLAKREGQRMAATETYSIRTADQVLGERLLVVGEMLLAEFQEPGSVLIQPEPTTHRLPFLLAIAQLALLAVPYLWTEEVRITGVSGLEIPRHVLSPKLLPVPRSWHTFEADLPVLDREGAVNGEGAGAVLICDAGEGLISHIFGNAGGQPFLGGAAFRYGATYPDDFPNEFNRHAAESILKLLAFLNSPYIPKEQKGPSRAARREAQRLGHPLDDEHVNFIILRRPSGYKPASDDAPDSVEWKHRWIVNGHLRAQWYPSEQAHRVIWIAPYMKGPEDAPLLEHAYKVAR